MSNLIRKKALEDACDGLKGLSNYIAEDYFMTVKMASAGYQFRMSSYPALQNQTNTSICGFFSRMLRWSKLRIKMLPGNFRSFLDYSGVRLRGQSLKISVMDKKSGVFGVRTQYFYSNSKYTPYV